MSIIKLCDYLKGSLTVQADGPHPERFLTVCIKRNLNISQVTQVGENRLRLIMSLPAFRQIRPVCFRTKTRLTVLSRNGLPFLLHRLRRRKYSLIGLLGAVLFLWYTTCHIMGITIIGNNRIDTQTVLDHLARSGVSMGKSTAGIDSDRIRNRMMRDLDGLAWVGINVSGSRIYVEIVERLQTPPRLDSSVPCHLIASKDGELLAIEAREGQTMVTVGSGVRKGDLLVSGLMDIEETGMRMVHARGEVFAKTVYTETKEYPLTYTKVTETGNTASRYSLTVLTKTLPLFFRKPRYETYALDTTDTEYRLPLERLPSLWVKKEVYREQTESRETRTVSQVLAAAKEELFPPLISQVPQGGEILDRGLSHTLTEQGTVKVTATLVCKENIAEKSPINIDKSESVDYDKQ